MAIEEAGGYCDFCQRPVLGRRQGLNHVVFALFSIFTCGFMLIVWLIAAMVHGGEAYACPVCGNLIRAGAIGPLPPAPDPGTWSPPPARKGAPGIVLLGAAALGLLAFLFLVAFLLSREASGPRSATMMTTTTSTTLPPITVVRPSEARRIFLSDRRADDVARRATFSTALLRAKRACDRIATMSMLGTGGWSVTCAGGQEYRFAFDAEGSFVSAYPVTP